MVTPTGYNQLNKQPPQIKHTSTRLLTCLDYYQSALTTLSIYANFYNMPVTPKMQRYAELRAKHPTESKYKLALKAGYSEETASQPSRAIESKQGYKELLAKYAPVETALEKLGKLVQGEKTSTTIDSNGKIITRTIASDNQTALGAVKLTAQLNGLLKEDTPVVNVNILASLLGVESTDTQTNDSKEYNGNVS